MLKELAISARANVGLQHYYSLVQRNCLVNSLWELLGEKSFGV